MSQGREVYPTTEWQLQHHKTIRPVLFDNKKMDSFAGVIPLLFPNGIEKEGVVNFAVSIEGVGTKILVAQLAGEFRGIGIDLVAMNVNDILCLGAKPFAFADYVALGEFFPKKCLEELMKGIKEGARTANAEIISGETAVVPETLKGITPELAIDVAGSSVGLIEDKPIDGSKIDEKDVVIGLPSSGMHSNGFTLARPALLRYFATDEPSANYEINDVFEATDRPIWRELLEPTKIYVPEVTKVIESSTLHGLAHITGQAFEKLKRLYYLNNCGILLDNLPDPPEIMKKIKEIRKLSYYEMYGIFNMGIGFCIVTPKDDADDVITTCKKFGTNAVVIGRMTKRFSRAIKIVTSGETIIYKEKSRDLHN